YIEYNSSKYSPEFIQTFAHCYENVLRQFMARESISEVEAIQEEQEKRLDSFNDTDVPYDETQTVVSLFHEAVQKYPQNTALIFEDKKFTYAELDSRANDIAARIVRLGCGHGDVAALMLPRDEHMPMASLGILKAGCAYQPLDPTYPPERLNFMVKDADARVLVTTKELRHLVGDYAGEILYIDEIPHAEDFSPECAISPDDLFVILYTSGSTGVPKGVKLTHGNLVCNIHWYWRYFGLQPEHRTALYAGFGFDMHMFDLYSSLTRGAAACMVPEDMRLDFPALNAYLEANGVTHMFITTQVGRQFAADVDNHSLHHLCVAGEKLVTVQPPKNFALHNGYGPSETTMLVTIFRVDALYKNIPIGKPLDNVKLYIVDVNGHRLPIGACGELWAAGPQVGAGYLNRPEKTAEVFIKNPFEGGKYENVYKTGDIVRYRRDGNLEFVGRRDGQVKIRGFRIELSEVEAVIREFPGIKDATVAAFDNPAGGKSVAAYIVSDAKIDIEEMNRFISERKPPYMVPAVTMQIEKIPLNPNGKV
ncbi:MAG: amino acid adenylation domain-containing protein, partial [Selenomonadaceae bacterium]|nr:amino acid adenylation domain-containing protein [Selenomonadaceae bacterium]